MIMMMIPNCRGSFGKGLNEDGSRRTGENRVKTGDRLLALGGAVTGVAALLHLAIVVGGPGWYRFVGAGERVARLAAHGSIYPAVITTCIAAILGVWTLYALSGAGVVRHLPFLRPALALIAAVFLARGILGIPAVMSMDDPYARARTTFMVASSAICTLLGLCYGVGAARARKPSPAPRRLGRG